MSTISGKTWRVSGLSASADLLRESRAGHVVTITRYAPDPAETFTGEAWVDPITRGLPPSQLNVAVVRFSPGARSAWHTHDGGQTLHVTEGRGLVQVRGQQAVELRPGDVIYAPDGEEHWHGATPDDFMTHLSITEGAPHWGDHVTDHEY
jgi:quercetin dioxygenase-like cupin family protein